MRSIAVTTLLLLAISLTAVHAQEKARSKSETEEDISDMEEHYDYILETYKNDKGEVEFTKD